MKQKNKPNLEKFFKASANKAPSEQPLKERKLEDQIELVQKANSKFKDYNIKEVEAYKIQIDCIIKFGDIQSKRQIPDS